MDVSVDATTTEVGRGVPVPVVELVLVHLGEKPGAQFERVDHRSRSYNACRVDALVRVTTSPPGVEPVTRRLALAEERKDDHEAQSEAMDPGQGME